MYPSVISCQITEVSTLITAIINYIITSSNKLKKTNTGVTIHQNLKWASHINKISNKANSVLGLIQRNLKHANRDLKELAYTSLVRSILEYSSTVWDPFYQKDIDRLERAQQRDARFVSNDYKPLSRVTSMVSQLGWKPLAERRREHRLSLLYKIINDQVAIPADTHLHFNARNTRINNSKSLKLPICTTDTFKHSFFPATIRVGTYYQMI